MAAAIGTPAMPGSHEIMNLAMLAWRGRDQETRLIADAVIAMDAGSAMLVGMMVLGTVVFGLYWTPVVSFADRSLVFFGS